MSLLGRSKRSASNTNRTICTDGSLSLGSSDHGICGRERDFSQFGCCYLLALRNRDNLGKSKAPSRLMFYKDSEWSDYPPEVFSLLKEGFMKGRRAAMYVETEGACFVVDFLRMLEVDLQRGFHRSIAWIDIEGHCFFPQLFCAQNFASSKEYNGRWLEMEINSGIRGRDDAAHMAESESVECNPKTNLQCNTVSGRGTDLVPRDCRGTLFRLEENGKAYNIVKSVFLKGMEEMSSKTIVSAVYRCPSAHDRFQDLKRIEERIKVARGHANRSYAWYGADKKEIGSVLLHGFGKSSVSSGSEAFGIGVNLSAADSSYLSASLARPDDNGDQYVILCRVIMGTVEKVQTGSKQGSSNSEEFDNGVDDAMYPKRCIVWRYNMDSHILPQYVVTFRSSTQLQVTNNTTMPIQEMSHGCAASESVHTQVRGSLHLVNRTAQHSVSNSSMSFLDLFAALEKSLPLLKTKELNLLYDGFKARKIQKEVLIRKVRLIVGDRLLVSTIKSLRRQTCHSRQEAVEEVMTDENQRNLILQGEKKHGMCS